MQARPEECGGAAALVDGWLRPDGDDLLGTVAAWLFPVSMALGLIGLLSAIYALVRRDRSWRMWLGLVTGGLVVVFWLLFAVGELVFPH